MKLSFKDMKIAKKIFLAYSYRHKIWESNFNNHAQKGIVLFNYHHYPLLVVYNNGDDTFTSMKTISLENSINRYSNIRNNGEEHLKIEHYLTEMFDRYRLTQKNFRNAMFNFILANQAPDETWTFLMDNSSIKQHTSEQMKNILTKQYDVRIEEFYKLLQNKKEDVDEIVIDNLSFQSVEELDADKLMNITSKITTLLRGSSLLSLLYGVVEVKNSFQNHYVGDYQVSTDVIRTGGEENNFISTFIHELGHRWHFKYSTKKQENEFKKLYDNCRGKQIELKKGDVVTFYGSNSEYIYIDKAFSSLMLKNKQNNKIYYYKLIATRSMETINGEKIEKYRFPNNYSKTKFKEFIAVCIQYAYCNLSMDENLKQKVKQIIG